MKKLTVTLLILWTLTACNNFAPYVDSKSVGRLPQACPSDGDDNYMLAIKYGPERDAYKWECVSEETWAKYKKGDPWP